ncbi:hypothetical protein BGZ97_000813 [Linnemannia gamsii]|uniref:Galactose oxidase n=1 Tax=Linnemannia gamsii TaxID=64522 RepID=A0A9P6UJX5_9FUNG|nr:hypothetical protein BGZ97_000813 [Linnemannia gamsii]
MPAWTKHADGPLQDLFPAALSSDEKILYVFHIPQSSSPFQWDSDTEVWKEMTNVKFANASWQGIGAVTDPRTGLIYLAGGYNDDSNLGNDPTFLAMDVFDPVSQTLNRTHLTLPPRTFLARLYYGNVWCKARSSILYWGGHAYNLNPSIKVDMVSEFKPDTQTWSTMVTTGTTPAMRADHCMVPSEDGAKVVIYGGRLENGTVVGDISVLDTAAQTWTAVAIGPSRMYAACAVAGDQLIIWGGKAADNLSPPAELIIYNFVTRTWVSQYTPPTSYRDLKDPPTLTRTAAPWPVSTEKGVVGSADGGVKSTKQRSLQEKQGHLVSGETELQKTLQELQELEDQQQELEQKRLQLVLQQQQVPYPPPPGVTNTSAQLRGPTHYSEQFSEYRPPPNNPEFIAPLTSSVEGGSEFIGVEGDGGGGGAENVSERRTVQDTTGLSTNFMDWTATRSTPSSYDKLDKTVKEPEVPLSIFMRLHPPGSLPAQSFIPTVVSGPAYARTITKFYVVGGAQSIVPDVRIRQFMYLDLLVPFTSTAPAWTQLADGPQQSNFPAAFSSDEKILYVFHIPGTNSPWQYTIADGTWQEVTATKFENADWEGIGAVTDPKTGLIYLAGGYDDINAKATALKIINIFDPVSQTIDTQSLPPAERVFPIRWYYGNVWSRNRSSVIYWGGVNRDSRVPVAPVENGVTEFVPDLMGWYTMPIQGVAPQVRAYHCMAANEDGTKIVIYGGRLRNNTIVGELWVLNLITYTWTQATTSGPPRSHAACTIAGDQFLLWGGRTDLQVEETLDQEMERQIDSKLRVTAGRPQAGQGDDNEAVAERGGLCKDPQGIATRDDPYATEQNYNNVDRSLQELVEQQRQLEQKRQLLILKQQGLATNGTDTDVDTSSLNLVSGELPRAPAFLLGAKTEYQPPFPAIETPTPTPAILPPSKPSFSPDTLYTDLLLSTANLNMKPTVHTAPESVVYDVETAGGDGYADRYEGARL